ncbi:hypothetical protein EDC04DRAFT_2898410 [Pisolithus marmoratus]|nr:hypothetical protein EDC04DRAFT_2898410 [Pisolithus marmoratus]
MTSPPQTELEENTVQPHSTLLTNGLKHPHIQLVLPFDRSGGSPHKRIKKLMTTVRRIVERLLHLIIDSDIQATASVSEEVKVLRSQCRLQVAWATQDALAAGLRYQQLHLQEIKLMQTIAIDDCKEAEALLKAADHQVGEVKLALNCEGRGLLNPSIPLLPRGNDNDEDTNCSGSECGDEGFASPAPSFSNSTLLEIESPQCDILILVRVSYAYIST